MADSDGRSRRALRLFDTAEQAVVPFDLPPSVGIYVCGITPYDAGHIGHAAAMLLYDVLVRHLEDRGHEVTLVRNVTDVDDSIIGKARELGVDYAELGREQTARFRDDLDALGMRPPTHSPLASDGIDDIIALAERLIATGHAYAVDGYVFFDTTTFERFGQVSHLDHETMLEFAAERGGFPDDQRKRNPLDFVVWQRSLPDEPSWPSPWGPGRPGWHAECSVLAMRYLGTPVDIHGGGSDLIFPHHECEAAQTEAITGKPFVSRWVHQAMVRMGGEKMSKSLGNVTFVGDLRKRYDPRAIRLALSSKHYRDPWEYDEALIAEGEERLARWVAAGEGDAAVEDVREALDDDLDMPRALDAIDRAAAAGEGVSEAARLLGIDITG